VNNDGIRELLIRALSDPVDPALLNDPDSWALIRGNASRFGVAQPIAFAARLYLRGAERTWCDRQLVQSWGRFHRDLRDLEYVAALLHGEAIQAIPLKGPLLALRCYDPPFLRKPSVDLDIAVRSRDLERACAALVQAGYSSGVELDEATAFHHEIAFHHPSRTSVELHFRLSHGARGIPVEEFFDRAIASTLPSGLPSLRLSPSDELLHLALHVSSDRFRSLFHLYELHRIWRTSSSDVREAAVRTGLAHGFAGALALIDVAFRLRWGEPFTPPGVSLPKTWLHWRVNERLYRSFENWFQPDFKLGRRLRGRWLDLQTTDRASDALRIIPVLARVARVRLRLSAGGR
jgi:hypothetical protein